MTCSRLPDVRRLAETESHIVPGTRSAGPRDLPARGRRRRRLDRTGRPAPNRFTDLLTGGFHDRRDARLLLRPDPLPALLDRFRSITLGFFQKHGIEQIGFWTTLVGPDNHALTYLLKWDDMAQREACWNAFQADPD